MINLKKRCTECQVIFLRDFVMNVMNLKKRCAECEKIM